MQTQVITLPFQPDLGHFDQSPWENFIKSKTPQILQCQNHFSELGGQLYCHIFVCFHQRESLSEIHSPKQIPPGKKKKSSKPEIKIPEQDKALYESLAKWRSQKRQEEGVPSYMIFHNQSLKDIAQNRPRSLVDLRKIPGIGASKIQKYGPSILTIITREEENKGETK